MTPSPTLLRAAVAATCCALAVGSLASPAHADDAATARDQARLAAREVRTLTGQVQRAQQAYDRALGAVGQQVTGSVQAQTDRGDSQQLARRADADRANTARALYMSGGHSALLSTVLAAHDPGDLAGRAVAVDRVLRVAQESATVAVRAQGVAAGLAADAARTADASVVTASLVAERAAAVDVLAAAAQRRLDRLSTRARRMTDAEQAAAALSRARAQAAAAAAAAIGSVRAQPPPAAFFALYRAAAATCPGMPWTLLAAVGQVESGHGRNNGPSSAGAVGPMQFMPRTFASFAVDGDRDGRADPWAPSDAVYTAARFLCTNGGGAPAGQRRALLRYNNAQWYVDLVLGVQAQLEHGGVEGRVPGG